MSDKLFKPTEKGGQSPKYLSSFFLVLFLAYGVSILKANNLQISSISLSNPDTAANSIRVTFNIAWENSWRLSTAPGNYDAAWVFVKYRRSGTSNWGHATLNINGHTSPTAATVTASSDGKGVFIYRSSNGSGNVSFSNIQLSWNYTADGLTDFDSVQIRVFGTEMVYVPQGNFYAGDGENRSGHLYGNFEDGNSGNPLQITSEAALTLGGGASGSLGNNNRSGHFSNPGCDGDGCLGGSGDDFDDSNTRTLPAAFPKGYQAFYCMKYELCQQQMVDMLNTLSSQQLNLVASTNHFYPSAFQASNLRYGISVTSGVYSTTQPYVALNYTDWIRAAAYADWAAMRPMTELEFEKACRGPSTSVMGEYPWGNAAIDLSANLQLSGSGTATESVSSGYDSSGTEGNCWINDASNHTMTVIARVGIFSAHPANSGRVTAGASYYGLMEMGGNAWERAVSVGHTEGRKFTGIHGDGALDTSGYANASNWPGTFSGGIVDNNVGVGYRGGGLAYPTPNTERSARVSSRVLASAYFNAVIHDDGVRFVRTAP